MKFTSFKSAAVAGIMAAMLVPSIGVAGDWYDDYNKTVTDFRGHPVCTFNGACIVHLRWPGPAMPECEGKQVAGEVQMMRKMVKVYFNFDSTSLTKKAKMDLDALISAVGGRAHKANLVGYADRVGDVAYNRELSKKRALMVANYLRDGGIINAKVANIRALGESDPSTKCSGGFSKKLVECLQEDRRVDVEVEYQPMTR